jgi:hypothetical protein
MKKIFLLLFITTSFLFCQNKSIDDAKKIISKIKVGMSQSDVKAIIGLPDAVEGGFPYTDDLIIKGMPEQRGQLNNSTWFYKRKTYYLQRMIETKYTYFINDEEVPKYIYNDYHSSDSVYILGYDIIPHSMAEQYKILKDTRLHIKPIDTSRTFMKTIKGMEVYDIIEPIICVIFDRGTNVVAATKYFELIVKLGDVE